MRTLFTLLTLKALPLACGMPGRYLPFPASPPPRFRVICFVIRLLMLCQYMNVISLNQHCQVARCRLSAIRQSWTVASKELLWSLLAIESHSLGSQDLGCMGEVVSPQHGERAVAGIIHVKKDHCTALRAVQDPSMTPTSLLGIIYEIDHSTAGTVQHPPHDSNQLLISFDFLGPHEKKPHLIMCCCFHMY